MNIKLSHIDWIIFFSILLITFASVLYGNFSKPTQKNSQDSFLDHLLMGRKLTLPFFIATLVATWYGGIFGVTAIAFEQGIYNFLTQGVFWYISYLVFAFFLVDKIKKSNAITLPNMIGEMFGEKSAKLAAIFNFFNVVPITYVISLGLLLQTLFGGGLLFNMIVGVFFVVLYSLWGGFRAVVYSDLIQFFVMCIAVVAVLAFSISNFGGIEFLTNNLPETHFSLLGGETIAATFVWGFIALSTLVDPNFYHRCFAAKDSATAKKGIILSTIIWFCFDICTTLGAMYARASMPDLDPSNAYMVYALEILPTGVKGLFLAGILATILSTIDSYIFIAGTTLSVDLAPKRFKYKPNTQYLGIILVAVISIAMSLMFDGNIKSVWKTLGSYSASCLLLPVLAGYLFPNKISDNNFFTTCLVGVILTTIWRSIDRTGIFLMIDELYIGILSTMICLFLFRKH